MKTVFVGASGTEVGKTFVMCRLINELKYGSRLARILKPVVTGFDPRDSAASDTGRLLLAQGLPATTEHLDAASPWRFAAALSPDMAAAREGRSLSFEELVKFCKPSNDFDLTLIEGIGGVMVPLDENHTVLDWIAALDPVVFLVVGSYLGTLSHTLTAAGMLQHSNATLAGVVVSESVEQPTALQETVAVLERFLAPTPIVALPRQRGASESSPKLLPLLEPYL